jgi:hypothetical protein
MTGEYVSQRVDLGVLGEWEGKPLPPCGARWFGHSTRISEGEMGSLYLLGSCDENVSIVG